ncbi:hypothetical protein PGTUg99_029210 [Puccinia graminis f. sp. tritici]|uniref:Uncharacterized protein n=1 Tax=Puccinia graminis f. sp. tritici TaxID=56615 RepID=A0A5B0N0P7_PUCGR|nr:hypothetical protein PGTUg99_029210 [Puccinia graminis f. sp. tritici]
MTRVGGLGLLGDNPSKPLFSDVLERLKKLNDLSRLKSSDDRQHQTKLDQNRTPPSDSQWQELPFLVWSNEGSTSRKRSLACLYHSHC